MQRWLLFVLCSTPSLFGASGQVQVYTYDAAQVSLTKGVHYIWKKFGMPAEEYGIDQEAQAIYANMTQSLELTFANGRTETNNHIYRACLENDGFSSALKQLTDRSAAIRYWLPTWITNGNHEALIAASKAALILSPGITHIISTALREIGKPLPAHNVQEDGFLDATLTVPPITEHHTISDAQTNLRNVAPKLAIGSPVRAFERKTRKLTSSSFVEESVFDKTEIEKSKNVYTVLYSHFRSASEKGEKMQLLFDDARKENAFLPIFKQYCERVQNNSSTLLEKLRTGSHERVATLMKEHHITIAPVLKMLAYEMILNNMKETTAVPSAFKELYQSKEKPIAKCIALFCNSLDEKTKRALLEQEHTILAKEKDEHIKLILGVTNGGDRHLDLLAEIKDAHKMHVVFSKIKELIAPSAVPTGTNE